MQKIQQQYDCPSNIINGFINNTATENGGGLFVQSANVYIFGESLMEGNMATNYGGAIYMYLNSLYMNNSRITGNTAGIWTAG